MIVGVNRVFAHGGKDYHIQVEDLGEGQAAFEVRVYDQGAVLWRKKVPYADVLAKGLPHLEQDEELRVAHGEDHAHRAGRHRQGQADLSPAVRRRALAALLAVLLLAAAFLSPRAIPYDMDEFAPFHALGCAAHPLSRQFQAFREGCQAYGLRPPLLPVALPLRSYLYIGSLPVLPFYPFWRILDDPVAVRVQGALFLLVALFLAARLLAVPLPTVALAAFVFPLFPGSFLVDTGPVGLSLVLLLSALILVRHAAGSGSRSALAAGAAGFLCFLGVWTKPVFAWSLPAAVAYGVAQSVGRPPRRSLKAALAFLASLALPSSLLLLSQTAEGARYYEVLSVGRFSLAPESLGTVAASLLAYLWNGSSLAPRSVFFPPSLIDRLPLALAGGILLAGLVQPAPSRRGRLAGRGPSHVRGDGRERTGTGESSPRVCSGVPRPGPGSGPP